MKQITVTNKKESMTEQIFKWTAGYMVQTSLTLTTGIFLIQVISQLP